jgi:hypothetical protein
MLWDFCLYHVLLQVVVFCMVGLYEDDVILAISSFIDWYEIACRKKEYSEATLTEMDELMHLYVCVKKIYHEIHC